MQTIEGFLLSRQWRDTPRGVDLSMWAATPEGPLRLSIPETESVCFLERSVSLPPLDGTRRNAVDLTLLGGEPVDAIYFKNQRTLAELRQHNLPLCESDIKPAERYLMERFVNAAFVATGDVTQHDGYLEILHPKLKPSTTLTPLKSLSLDIETRGMTQQLYSIAGASDTENRVFMIGNPSSASRVEKRGDYSLVYCESESQALSEFFDWVATQDPDVLTGWSVVNFDLDFIYRKCQSLNLPFRLSRGQEPAIILQPSSGSGGGPRIARIPGRAVLDGIDLLKAGFWSFESFALDAVANQLLGKRKLITGEQDKLAEINRLYNENKPELADYNIEDCKLVREIFEAAGLLPFAMQRAQITGLSIDRMGGSVAALDHLYLPRLHRHKYVAPDVGDTDGGLGSPGGYVMDSQPGLYKNVLVLDFKSLYPSIIRTFRIDPLGLALGKEQRGLDQREQEQQETSGELISGFHDAWFSRDKHILPELIENLWSARDEAKRQQDAALSQAIKIIMNSFYGVLGSSGCRFHSQQLASSITRRGHEIITRTRDYIEEQGYSVIYGDTDSVFVLLPESLAEDEANSIGVALMDSLNEWWTETLDKEHGLVSALEVEFETHYLRFLMPTVRGMSTGSKKRYAGMVRRDGQDTELVFKGLEAVRTDWTPLAREFQKELYRRVFHDEPYEDFVRESYQMLLDGQCDEQLVYRKRLRRKLSDYQRNVPPHVQAARKQKKSGHWVSYIITRNGPEPIDALESAPDYQHYVDKQLAPSADSLLYFLDTSFASITDAQMQMF